MADEYETKIKRHFLGNKIVRLWSTLGLLNDSYEFRMSNDAFTFDMFLVYKINSTHQWCGYQVNRKKYRRYLPNMKICSAELFNQKYMIPCDPVSYLDQEYGPSKWYKPIVTNYEWKNIFFHSTWNSLSWPHAVKFYDRNGNLLIQKIKNYVNTYLKDKIQTVPLDLDF